MPETTIAAGREPFGQPLRLPLAGSRAATDRCGWHPSLRSAHRSGRPGRWRQPLAATDLARELDAEACAAAALEVRCRIVQGELASALLARRLWRPLGFSRLSDYAGERLGLSGRRLEEDARVVRALDTLPATRRAFTDAAIRWTQVRFLTSVATTETEAGWLRLALTTTTRQLAGFTSAARRGDVAPSAAEGDADGQGPDACAPGADACDLARRPHERVRRVPDACAPISDACDSAAAGGTPCRRTASSASLPRQADAASFASGAAATDASASGPVEDDPFVRWTIVGTRGGRKLWRSLVEYVSRMSGVDVAPSQVAEAVAAEAMGSDLFDAPGPPLPTSRERGRTRPGSADDREGFDWLPPPARARACGLEHLLDGLAEADAHGIDSRLRSAVSAMQRIDARLGAALCSIADRSLHRSLGFPDLRTYAEARLGVCGSKALALVRLERQCATRCPLLLEAYREGRVGWLAASALVPVLHGTGTHDLQWIERARAVTLRRLVSDVRWALDRADDLEAISLPGPPPPLDLDTTADDLARIDLAEVQMRARSCADVLSFSRRVGALLTIRMPGSVAALLEDAIEGCRRAVEPRWRGFERILAHAYLTWSSFPPHENPVFARDSYRCQVPGCSRRAPLHAHHVRFRSHGGPDDAWNLTAVCDDHHREFLHRGCIRVEGRAPDALTWELGCRPGRPPLMRLRGDVYLRDTD